MKVRGLLVECNDCKTKVAFTYLDEKKSCKCGKMLEVSKGIKNYYLNRNNSITSLPLVSFIAGMVSV